jgi:hypothetical protein
VQFQVGIKVHPQIKFFAKNVCHFLKFSQGQVRCLMAVDRYGNLTILRIGTSLIIMLTSLWMWKRPNAVIFNGARPDLGGLLDTIKTKASSWVTAGVLGLATILPPA